MIFEKEFQSKWQQIEQENVRRCKAYKPPRVLEDVDYDAETKAPAQTKVRRTPEEWREFYAQRQNERHAAYVKELIPPEPVSLLDMVPEAPRRKRRPNSRRRRALKAAANSPPVANGG